MELYQNIVGSIFWDTDCQVATVVTLVAGRIKYKLSVLMFDVYHGTEPMELLQNWRDVLVSSHTSDQTRRGVLDGLYASEQVVGDAIQKWRKI